VTTRNNGQIDFMAFVTREGQSPQAPEVPGICTECGALVPGLNVTMMTKDGFTDAVFLHTDWHRRHGDVPETMDAPHD
jgi:hypothetical protein